MAECDICGEHYNTTNHEPKILLPCCHTVCSGCVVEMRGSFFKCPFCQTHVTDTKKNFALSNLLEASFPAPAPAPAPRKSGVTKIFLSLLGLKQKTISPQEQILNLLRPLKLSEQQIFQLMIKLFGTTPIINAHDVFFYAFLAAIILI